MNQSMQQADPDQAAENSAPPPTTPARFNYLLALLAVLLLWISSSMLYGSIGSYIRSCMALQYKTGEGTVSSIEEHYDPLGIRKEVHLRFVVDGHENNSTVEMPANRVMKKGELTAIYYDKNHPENAVLSTDIDYDSVMVYGAFGLFIFCFGAWMASRLFLRR